MGNSARMVLCRASPVNEAAAPPASCRAGGNHLVEEKADCLEEDSADVPSGADPPKQQSVMEQCGAGVLEYAQTTAGDGAVADRCVEGVGGRHSTFGEARVDNADAITCQVCTHDDAFNSRAEVVVDVKKTDETPQINAEPEDQPKSEIHCFLSDGYDEYFDDYSSATDCCDDYLSELSNSADENYTEEINFHHILSPILEETEDSQSFRSSLAQLDSPPEGALPTRSGALTSRSSDSLASFEAHERFLLSLQDTPLRKAGLNDDVPPAERGDRAEASNLGLEACERHHEGHAVTQDGARGKTRDEQGGCLFVDVIDECDYDVCFDTSFDEEPDRSSEDGTLEPEVVNTANEGTKQSIRGLNQNDDELWEEDDSDCFKEKHTADAAHLHGCYLEDGSGTKTDYNRRLSLYSLKQNCPFEQEEEACAAMDEDLGYPVFGALEGGHQRPREDSVMDLSSLHSNLQQAVSNPLEPQIPCSDVALHMEESKRDTSEDPGLLDSTNEEELSPNTPDVVDFASLIYSTCVSPTDAEEDIVENDPREHSSDDLLPSQSDSEVPLSKQVSPISGRHSSNVLTDSAFDTVSSFEGDFLSCASDDVLNSASDRTRRNDMSDDCLSDPGYRTPLECSDDDASGSTMPLTGARGFGQAPSGSCGGQTQLSPLTTTLVSSSKGYQTPPKYFYVIPPKFLGDKTTNMSVVRGATAHLACSLVAHPEARVAWYKDGRLMEIYDRLSQETTIHPPPELSEEYSRNSWTAPLQLPEEEDADIGSAQPLDVHYVLKINHTTAKDEGSYICKAWNSAGVATRVIRLVVLNYPDT